MNKHQIPNRLCHAARWEQKKIATLKSVSLSEAGGIKDEKEILIAILWV